MGRQNCRRQCGQERKLRLEEAAAIEAGGADGRVPPWQKQTHWILDTGRSKLQRELGRDTCAAHLEKVVCSRSSGETLGAGGKGPDVCSPESHSAST